MQTMTLIMIQVQTKFPKRLSGRKLHTKEREQSLTEVKTS